jgi:hypothetical protein
MITQLPDTSHGCLSALQINLSQRPGFQEFLDTLEPTPPRFGR